MKKLSFAFFISFLLLQHATLNAQTKAPDQLHKAIYAEAFGQGLHAGLHYDSRLIKERLDGPGFRLGIAGTITGISDAGAEPVTSGVLAFPVGLNYLIGQNRSALEAGLGVMPLRASTDLLSPTRPRVVHRNGWSSNGFINLGYRFQPLENGFTFRLNWTPVFNSTGFISRFGISAGYAFY